MVLGAVRIFEPINAYQLRRELTTWRVEDWAHVNPGSIYTALATLAKQGHVTRHDLDEGTRTVAVYTTTASGQLEFERLLEDALVTYDQSSLLGLYTALSLSPLVPRERMLGLLRRRLDALDRLWQTGDRWGQEVPVDDLPGHLPMITRLWVGLGRFERDWLADSIARIERGESAFLGEPNPWVPATDESGKLIQRDRERYRKLLSRWVEVPATNSAAMAE